MIVFLISGEFIESLEIHTVVRKHILRMLAVTILCENNAAVVVWYLVSPMVKC